MDDQLDKDLSRRIAEVFDNYQDTTVNEGWLKLREKFPEKRHRRGLVWLWPAAALLLLFFGVGLVILFNKKPKDNQIVRSKPVQQSLPVQHDNSRKVAAKSTAAAPLTYKDLTQVNRQNAAASNTHPTNNNGATVTNATIASPTKKPGLNLNHQRGIAANGATVSRPVNAAVNSGGGNPTSPVSGLAPGVGANQTSPLLARIDTSGKKGIILNNADQNFAVNTKPAGIKKDTSAAKPITKKSSAIDEMFAADQAKNDDNIKLKSDMRVKFGVYAATYINYAKNGNNQVNAGAGLTAAIPITKNLKLVTGASVNQNSFSYNNQVMLAPQIPAVMTAGYTQANVNYVSATNVTYSHTASLLGIDVPLNLQYQFNTRKNPVYVLGGFSSGTFINESYSNVYSNGATIQSQPTGSLNDFYFARTLNLGFGVGYPLGKSQLVIEPFLKYPLSGMGAEQLKFGASGINLKFNFGTKK